MNKIILILIIFLFLPFVNGLSYQQGENINLRHPIRINGGIDSSISANITIQYQNNSLIVNFGVMSYDSSSQRYNYTLLSNFTNNIATYNYCRTSSC